MKKNYLGLLLAVTCVASLTGCSKFSDEVLAHAQEGYGFHVAGQNEVLVDGEWKANAWECNDSNKMEATSLKAVAEISEELATTLSTKEVKYLYSTEVRLGVADAGWTVKAMKDGKVHEQNGSYAIKAIEGHFDTDDQVYIADLWLPDPHKAHAESLTPSTLFMPTWTEAQDENGFSWSDNPVCIGEGGVYTLVVAQYTTVSSADAAGYGFALVLKEADANGLPHTEYVAPAADSYGIIGSFNGWAEDHMDLTATGTGTYEATLEIPADTEFKVRVNDGWDVSYGYEALANAADVASSFVDAGGNIKCVAAGNYKVTFDPATGQLTIVAA